MVFLPSLRARGVRRGMCGTRSLPSLRVDSRRSKERWPSSVTGGFLLRGPLDRFTVTSALRRIGLELSYTRQVGSREATSNSSGERSRAVRRRLRREELERRNRRRAERDAFLEAQLEPGELVVTRIEDRPLVTDRRILMAHQLMYPPRRGEWVCKSLAFDQITRWALGRRHDHRPILRLEHTPHARIERVPRHHFSLVPVGKRGGTGHLYEHDARVREGHRSRPGRDLRAA